MSSIKWKPVKDINNLPSGTFILVCDNNDNIDFVIKDFNNNKELKWFYCYTKSEVQNPNRFTKYCIPRT